MGTLIRDEYAGKSATIFRPGQPTHGRTCVVEGFDTNNGKYKVFFDRSWQGWFRLEELDFGAESQVKDLPEMSDTRALNWVQDHVAEIRQSLASNDPMVMLWIDDTGKERETRGADLRECVRRAVMTEATLRKEA